MESFGDIDPETSRQMRIAKEAAERQMSEFRESLRTEADRRAQQEALGAIYDTLQDQLEIDRERFALDRERHLTERGPSGPPIYIPDNIRRDLITSTAYEFPNFRGGILAGLNRRIERLINVHHFNVEVSAGSFDTFWDPGEHVRTRSEISELGLEHLGCYYSTIDDSARPNKTDLFNATLWNNELIQIVVAPLRIEGPIIRAWWAKRINRDVINLEYEMHEVPIL